VSGQIEKDGTGLDTVTLIIQAVRSAERRGRSFTRGCENTHEEGGGGGFFGPLCLWPVICCRGT